MFLPSFFAVLKLHIPCYYSKDTEDELYCTYKLDKSKIRKILFKITSILFS